MYIHIIFKDGSNPYLFYYRTEKQKQKELKKWQFNFILETSDGVNYVATEKRTTIDLFDF